MHPLDRPGQQPAYEEIMDSTARWNFLQAPTGLGKTALPAQAAEDGYRTMALVEHKSLQAENYQGNYNFDILYGKDNYPCRGADFRNASECDLSRSRYLQVCQGQCPYSVEKQKLLESQAACINYSKFLADKRLVKEYGPDILFLDEAHNLSKTTLDYCGITITFTKKILEYIEPFPISNNEQGLKIGRKWMQKLLDNLRPIKNKEAWVERRIRSLENTLHLMGRSRWYIRCTEKKFVCKPLTAQHHFKYLFSKASKIVAMSATISERDIAELGIEDYKFIKVENPWPAYIRPIYLLDAPRMRYEPTVVERERHLSAIKEFIDGSPSEWSGIIHSPSKELARQIYQDLRTSLSRLLFIPQKGQPTEQVARDWEIARRPGMIGVFWQMWEGADLGQDKINIIAKVPFVNFADEYQKACFDYNRAAAMQKVANKLMQGLGRIWRGRREDYGRNNSRVAIADANWTRVERFIQPDILEAFTKLK